jgi:hypothetical protein
MKRSAFAPDLFPVGLGILGAVLLLFPSLRVAGALALVLAAVYWLLISVFRLTKRHP